MTLKQAFPLAHFNQRCLYCFNGISMEYSLRRQLSVSGYGCVNKVLDWETIGLDSIPKGVRNFFSFFFLTCPQKQVSQV